MIFCKASAVKNILKTLKDSGKLYVEIKDLEELSTAFPHTCNYCYRRGYPCSKRMLTVFRDETKDEVFCDLAFYFPDTDLNNDGFIEAFDNQLQILVRMGLISNGDLTATDRLYTFQKVK